MTTLYHVTSATKLDAILSEGMHAGSYWTSSDDVADYYAETVEDEGETPVVLAIDLADLDEAHLEPDHPGIAEPITSAIGKSEDEVIEAWSEAEGTWRDSLGIVQSVRYAAAIAPGKLRVEGSHPEP